MLTIIRALSQATRCLSERASSWIVWRQQKILHRMSIKRQSKLYSSFYCSLESTENDTEISSKEDDTRKLNSPLNLNRPRVRASLLKRHRYLTMQPSNFSVKIILDDTWYEYLTQISNIEDVDLTKVLLLRQLQSSKPLRKRALERSRESIQASRKRLKRKKTSSSKSKKYHSGNSMAPIVPPRTKSALHQKPNSFHQAVRNGSRTPVVLPPSKEMKPLLSNSSVVLHQSTPLPEPPNIAGVAFTSKKGVENGGSAKKIISHPILNSSTISALQQPLQLINISSIAAKKATASTGMLPKSRLSVSNLPQVKTLDLGGGKSVPMNSLYESLLQESYFHPVVRNVLPKLLTKDRLFLVRPSTHSQHPLTLSLQEKAKIFNISIRMRKDAKYALGTEKPGEMSFSTVGEMIEWHRREPIKLEDGSLTYLTWTPAKSKPIIVHK